MFNGLGIATYPRCCEGATAAVNSDGQAYDSKGYCTIPADMGGGPGTICETQWISGFSNTTLMMVGAGLLLVLVLSGKR